VIRRRFVKFLRLSSADRWLVIRSFMALVLARMALAFIRFAQKAKPLDSARRVVALGERLLPAPMLNPPEERITWAVKAVSESVPGFGNCLVRAVALETLLKVAHHACELRIGVARTASGKFLAHAWIEKEGRMLIGEFKPGSLHPLTGPSRTL
jgi:Transglutaminase-like superfamily